MLLEDDDIHEADVEAEDVQPAEPEPIKTFDELFEEYEIFKPAKTKLPAPKKSSDKPLLAKQILAMHNAVRPKRTTIEVLTRSLIKDGELVTTDLEHCIRTKISEIPDPEYSTLADGLYTFSDDFTIPEKSIPIDDFPNLSLAESEPVMSCAFAFDRDLFSRMLPFVSKDELRLAIMLLYFSVTDSEIKLNATDGHMLAEFKIPCVASFETGESFGFGLHRDLIEILLKDAALQQVTVSVMRTNGTPDAKEPSYSYWTVIRPVHGKYVIYSKNECLSANRNYPPVKRVMPKEFKHVVTFSREALYSALTTLKKLMPKSVSRVLLVKHADEYWLSREDIEESIAARVPLPGSTASAVNVNYDYDSRQSIVLLMPVRFDSSNADVVNDHVFAGVDPAYLRLCIEALPRTSDQCFLYISTTKNGAADGAMILSDEMLAAEQSPFDV